MLSFAKEGLFLKLQLIAELCFGSCLCLLVESLSVLLSGSSDINADFALS